MCKNANCGDKKHGDKLCIKSNYKPGSRDILKICEFAGLLDPGSVLTRKRSSEQAHKVPGVGKFQAGSRTSNDTKKCAVIPIADGKMEWRLPPEVLTRMAFGGEIADEIKSLTKQLSEFAEKHCKNNQE